MPLLSPLVTPLNWTARLQLLEVNVYEMVSMKSYSFNGSTNMWA